MLIRDLLSLSVDQQITEAGSIHTPSGLGKRPAGVEGGGDVHVSEEIRSIRLLGSSRSSDVREIIVDGNEVKRAHNELLLLGSECWQTITTSSFHAFRIISSSKGVQEPSVPKI